ncbi:ABC transporter ATP-binding protein [Desulfuromonas versatilis]|uniref:ABC transporter ATP-binding protein n=1 Tax=Desulfuromonas versatilis TaxID=2802975 RepID=A0ABM8HRY7_9BACT|nr:ABC transporter ATP-binding protein [Desulfuromonas versatilis]BCR03206.1 ABC transporter ATP-binding protein [Desulfuromonas versatilis]
MTVQLARRARIPASEPQRPEVVCAADLAFRYPGASREAVGGLSLSILEGEVFGLLGPNGAGKTTTISMLSTLLRPGRGRLQVCGVDLLRQPRSVRSQIGLVPQEIALYPSLSVRENLSYFGRLHGLRGRELEQRVAQCLELVGLAEHGDRRIEACSGGMKRRANLAAGIVHRPRLLFLDEPTVGIDPQSRSTILENLARLKEQGVTLVYTTHYMEEAQQLCTRLAIVDGGRVIAEGTSEELIAAGDGCANLEELFLQLTGRQLRD